MRLKDLFEDEDDWEAEVASEEWSSFKVQPREGSAGWTSFAATAKVFDMAFGPGKWGQSGIPVEGTFIPMKVSIKPGVKINYAPLRDHGYKIVFFEGDPEYRKVHTKEDMPNRIHIDKSFYMEHIPGSAFMSYAVKQFMDDTALGVVYIFTSLGEGVWSFKPNASMFKGRHNKDDFEVFVSVGQMYNALKLKWWVKNRLIQLKLLPPNTQVKEDRRDENFGFRPEYKQFWFEIFNPDLFFAVQHEWQQDRGRLRQPFPDGSFIEMILNNFIMRAKPGHEGYSNVVVINPSMMSTDKPMVFMYDAKKGSPDIRKMKEYGIKPRFLEIDDAN